MFHFYTEVANFKFIFSAIFPPNLKGLVPILQHISWIFRNTPTFSLSDGFQRSYGHVFWDPPFFYSPCTYCFVILCLNIIVKNYDLCIRLGALLPLINRNIIYHLLYTCHDSTASLLDTRGYISFFYQLPECSPWSHSMSGLEMGQPWFSRRWTLGYIFAPRSSQDFPQMSNRNSDCRVCNDLQKW